MTTLQVFCKVFGWKGGTIHDAKQRFTIASMDEMDRCCGVMVDSMSEISDLETVQWFTQQRMEAIKLNTRAIGRV